jgi:hypothetical protein
MGATMNFVAPAPAVPVPVEYTSDLRSVASDTRGFLWQYGVSFGQEESSSHFSQELLVREGDHEFWIPVEESLIPSMTDHLAPGHSVTVYVRLLGSLETEADCRVIFVITDFEE